MPEPRAPTITGGRRPILSERLPTIGMTMQATMLPSTGIQRKTSLWKPMP